jgi:hypothetical protein
MAYIPELRGALVGVVNRAFRKASADEASDGWLMMSANGWPHPDPREEELWAGLERVGAALGPLILLGLLSRTAWWELMGSGTLWSSPSLLFS